MARQPAKAKAEASVSSIDPDKSYRVKVRHTIRLGKFGEMMLSPKADNIVMGYLLASLPSEEVESYEVV